MDGAPRGQAYVLLESINDDELVVKKKKAFPTEESAGRYHDEMSDICQLWRRAKRSSLDSNFNDNISSYLGERMWREYRMQKASLDNLFHAVMGSLEG